MVNKASVLGLASLIASAAVLVGCDITTGVVYYRRPFPPEVVLVQGGGAVVTYPYSPVYSSSIVSPYFWEGSYQRVGFYPSISPGFHNPHVHFREPSYGVNLPKHFPIPQKMPPVKPPMNKPGPTVKYKH